MLKIGVGFTEFRSLDSVEAPEDLEERCQTHLVENTPFRLNSLRLGHEFCERLMPSVNQVKKAIEKARTLDLSFSLVLANLTDKGHRKLDRLLPALPGNAQVTVNDWGTAARISEEYPALRLTAGRLMCKHLKEARISTPDENPEVTWPLTSPPFVELLGDLGMEEAEVDLAPHSKPPAKKIDGIQLSLHLVQGYSAKSHLCKVGSIHQPDEKKFTPENLCRRECLDYVSSVVSQAWPETDALKVHQRGNTWFYQYSDTMNADIAVAIENAVIDKAVVELD